jgi:hypothetical protein
MKRRREHGECEMKVGGRGCLVFGTPVCSHKKIERGALATVKKMGRSVAEYQVLLCVLVALVGVMVGLSWERMGFSLLGKGTSLG